MQFHFSLLFLLQRVIKLGPQKFACAICKAVMKSAQNVERHMHTHTGQKPFQCPHCSAAFTQKSNCLRHMLKLHSSIQWRKLVKSRFSWLSQFDEKKSCLEVTSYWFDSYFCLLQLLFEKQPIKLGPKCWSCPFCQITKRNRAHVETHIRVHTGEKPYSCPHCDSTFTVQSSCKRHILKAHKDVIATGDASSAEDAPNSSETDSKADVL